MLAFWISTMLIGALAGWLIRHIHATRWRRGAIAFLTLVPLLIYLFVMATTPGGPHAGTWFMVGLYLVALVTCVWFAAIQTGYWLLPRLPSRSAGNSID